jgi:hypothetical protein
MVLGRPNFFMMRFKNFSAATLSRRAVTTLSQNLAFVIDSPPEIAELAVDLHENLIQMPPPLGIATHLRHPPLPDLGGEDRAEPVPPKPDCLVAMSIPRSDRRSSTLRSDSGYFTYIITAKRIIAGELLKYLNGLLMTRTYSKLEAGTQILL